MNTLTVRRAKPVARRPHERGATRVDIHVPLRTLTTLTLWFLGIWFFTTLFSLVVQLVIGFMLASAFAPVVTRLVGRGISRGTAVATVGVGILLGIGLFLIVLIPALARHAGRFSENLPAYMDQLADRLRQYSPDLHDQFQARASGSETTIDELVTSLVMVGSSLIQAMVVTFSIAAFTVYLLLDGERIFTWLTSEVRDPVRTRLRSAIEASSHVVSSYVCGQVIASLLFGTFSFAVLSLTGVPEPLVLAILAAIMDALPIVGPVIATAPAALLAFTVSPITAIAVLFLYLVYQQIESYVIFPRVFRRTLHLHPLAVLLSVLVGTQLLGVIGALLALPISAVIPVVFRIWRSPVTPADNSAAVPASPVRRRSSIHTMRTRRA